MDTLKKKKKHIFNVTEHCPKPNYDVVGSTYETICEDKLFCMIKNRMSTVHDDKNRQKGK